MRKLKLQMQMSLDGYMSGPNGEMDWMTWNWDEGLKQYVGQITASIDTILLGRQLAEGFIPAWKANAATAHADDFSHQMVNIPKLVFSTSYKGSGWKNATLIYGDLAAEVQHLKQTSGQDLMAYGGIGFAASLAAHNLVDEYHLFINPIAIGKGRSIFTELQVPLSLKLIKSTAFECGITGLCYQAIHS